MAKPKSSKLPKQISGIVTYAQRRIDEGKPPTDAQFTVLRELASDGHPEAIRLLRKCFAQEEKGEVVAVAPTSRFDRAMIAPIAFPLAFAIAVYWLFGSLFMSTFAFAFAIKDATNYYVAHSCEERTDKSA
mgnify:CR=1 FL=1